MVDSHVEHVRDRIFISEQDLQGLTIEPLAMTDIAGDIYIRQELHLNPQLALSLAGFTASAMYVERETPRFVAAYFAFRQLGIKLSDLVEQTSVSPRIGTRCTTDR